jgi:hypothetical protein
VESGGFGSMKKSLDWSQSAYRRCQKQKDKEDGQGQRYLVIALTCARCDGNRQYQHKRDKGYGHYRQSGSAQWALLFRFAHRH